MNKGADGRFQCTVRADHATMLMQPALMRALHPDGRSQSVPSFQDVQHRNIILRMGRIGRHAKIHKTYAGFADSVMHYTLVQHLCDKPLR